MGSNKIQVLLTSWLPLVLGAGGFIQEILKKQPQIGVLVVCLIAIVAPTALAAYLIGSGGATPPTGSSSQSEDRPPSSASSQS